MMGFTFEPDQGFRAAFGLTRFRKSKTGELMDQRFPPDHQWIGNQDFF
jgi:hypothetical protein